MGRSEKQFTDRTGEQVENRDWKMNKT